jgi:hypothetical protein
MSVENTPVDVSTNEEISEEQLDKYFESRGTSITNEATQQEEKQTQSPVEIKDEKKEGEEKQVEVKDKIEKVVPYGALHEEREKRKELQRELQANAEKTRRMEEALERFQAQINQPAQKQPDFNDDPIEALKYQQEELRKRTEATNDFLRQQALDSQRQQAQIEFVNKYQQSAQAYTKENPDFKTAYGFLVENTKAELRAAGYNEDEVSRALIMREAEVVAKAYQDGVNPGERIYKLAQSRGYRTPVAETQQPSNAEQKIEIAKKGVEMSKSLDGGNPPPSKMTYEKLASLDDDDEFLKEFKKMHRRKF